MIFATFDASSVLVTLATLLVAPYHLVYKHFLGSDWKSGLCLQPIAGESDASFCRVGSHIPHHHDPLSWPIPTPIAVPHPFSSFVLLQGLQNAGVIIAIIFGAFAALGLLATIFHQIYKRILGSDREWLKRLEEHNMPVTNCNQARRGANQTDLAANIDR